MADSDDDCVLVSETMGRPPATTTTTTTTTSNKRARLNAAETAPCAAACKVEGPSIGPSGDFAADHLQCAICIDLLYDPCVGAWGGEAQGGGSHANVA